MLLVEQTRVWKRQVSHPTTGKASYAVPSIQRRSKQLCPCWCRGGELTWSRRAPTTAAASLPPAPRADSTCPGCASAAAKRSMIHPPFSYWSQMRERSMIHPLHVTQRSNPAVWKVHAVVLTRSISVALLARSKVCTNAPHAASSCSGTACRSSRISINEHSPSHSDDRLHRG